MAKRLQYECDICKRQVVVGVDGNPGGWKRRRLQCAYRNDVDVCSTECEARMYEDHAQNIREVDRIVKLGQAA